MGAKRAAVAWAPAEAAAEEEDAVNSRAAASKLATPDCGNEYGSHSQFVGASHSRNCGSQPW